MTLGIQTLLESIHRPDDCLETIEAARRAPSAIQGTGLFSTRNRHAGELVCRLDGQRVHLARFPELIELEWNALSEDTLLVRPLRTSYGYINHSDSPNLVIESDGTSLIVARDVAAGEEFTLDYFAPPVPPQFLESAEAALLRLHTARQAPR